LNYIAIKQFHIACVIASGSFFLLRGIWMLRESILLRRRWVRIVPHIVDSLLLASALTMAIWIGQYPFVQAWLTAKFIALILYIALGAVALRLGKTKAVRACAFFAALAVFAYIGSVAVTKQVFPFA